MPEHVVMYGGEDECVPCDLVKRELDRQDKNGKDKYIVTHRRAKDYLTIPEIKAQIDNQHGTLPVVWFPSRNKFIRPKDIIAGVLDA